jgi:hypothetical protein
MLPLAGGSPGRPLALVPGPEGPPSPLPLPSQSTFKLLTKIVTPLRDNKASHPSNNIYSTNPGAGRAYSPFPRSCRVVQPTTTSRTTCLSFGTTLRSESYLLLPPALAKIHTTPQIKQSCKNVLPGGALLSSKGCPPFTAHNLNRRASPATPLNHKYIPPRGYPPPKREIPPLPPVLLCREGAVVALASRALADTSCVLS